MLPNIGVLGLAIPVPAFTLLLGVWLALDQIERKSNLFSLEKKFIYNLGFNSLLIGLIGARITFYLTNPHLFISNPLGLITLSSDMMYLPGGLLSALILIIIISNKKDISLLKILDGFSPGIAIFMIFFHLANLFSGNSFGAEVDLPWSIDLWNAPRHPVQIYEFIIAGLIFLIIFHFGRNTKNENGFTFFLLLSLTAFSKLIFEAFHGDSQIIFQQFRTMQFAAWIIFAISLSIIIKLKQIKVE